MTGNQDQSNIGRVSGITGIPAPQGGVGSHELAIDSDDPEILRQNLVRARERLAFYESFDRIIGENIRRSGELMLETISLREEAQERERAAVTAETARAAANAAERANNLAILTELVAETERAERGLSDLRNRLQTAISSFGHTDSETTEPEASGESAPEPTRAERAADFVPDVPDPTDASSGTDTSPVEPPVAPTDAVTTTSAEDVTEPIDSPEVVQAAVPRRIDLLIHDVPRAAMALSLQRYLQALPDVEQVETREFAEGILRLFVSTTGTPGITDADFLAWADGGTLRVVNNQLHTIELAVQE